MYLMGLLFVIIAVTAFAVQGTLFTKYVRRYNATQVAYIRNISMIFTGLPLLFFVPNFSWALIEENLYWIFLAGGVGALHVIVTYIWYKNLPIWISQILKKSAKTITVLVLSFIFLWEHFSTREEISLLLIVGWSFLLMWQKIDILHLPKAHLWKWFFYITLAWILAALSWYFFVFYSKTTGSILWAYILEASVWFFYILPFLFTRYKASQSDSIEKKDIIAMMFLGMITYIGTVSMAVAFSYDRFGMVSLLQNLWIVVTLILWYFLFKEKITWKQGVIMFIILGGIIMLKMG